MLYTTVQLEILRKMQAGKTLIGIAAELNRSKSNITDALVRFRQKNGIKNNNEVRKILKHIRLPTAPAKKKYLGVYPARRGGWDSWIMRDGITIYVSTRPTQEAAYRDRQTALANVGEFLANKQKRRRPADMKWIYLKGGHWMVQIWHGGKNLYVGRADTIEEAKRLRDDYLNGIQHESSSGRDHGA